MSDDEINAKTKKSGGQKLRDCCNFFYNSEEGTVLGRTGKSWGKTVPYYHRRATAVTIIIIIITIRLCSLFFVFVAQGGCDPLGIIIVIVSCDPSVIIIAIVSLLK